MIRTFGEAVAHVTVISAGRPDSVARMTELVGPATWYVPEAEREAYEVRGAKTRPDSGSLCAARNRALEEAFGARVPCVQLSDDLKALRVLRVRDGKKTAEETTFDAVVQTLEEETFKASAYLGGGAPTANPFYASERTATNLFILGDLMFVRPTPLRFDTGLQLKEDYDYTCQHYAEYGAVARVGWIIPDFAHRTNAGGAVAFRTAELEQETIAKLKGKWPGWIRDNAKRPNEILLRLPRQNQAQIEWET